MSADAVPPRPKRMYGPSHIEVACRALDTVRALVQAEGGDHPAMEQICETAFSIIATGLAEIEAEHTRANAPEAP